MRKAYIILTGIFFTLLFTACRQFTADIDDYLSYWSAEAYIADSTIKAVVQNDLNNIPSVPSAQDVPVTFNLKNSKSFPLDLPPEADVEKKVIVFEHLAQVPKFGDDYTIVQSEDCQSLILTYKATFLQRYEWGEQDLSSTMTLYAKDGRKFKQTYTFKVKANTPPPKPTFSVARTTGTPSYYVLCITAPETDMRKTVAGRLLHKDLAHIEINETSYAFSVNEAEKKFVKPESDSFITLSDVAKLTAPDADKVPTGGWVLYYKTDVEVKEGAAKKDYTIRLADEKGLVSAAVNASTKPNRPAPVQISLVKGICTADVNSDNTGAAPHIIGVDGGHKPATLRLTCATADSTIYYTLTEIGAGSLASPLTASGAGSGVDIPLPIQPGKTEAEYTLTVRAEADGFETGAERTLYYKITAQNTDTALSALKLTEGSDEYSAALIAGSDSAYICKIPFAERIRNLTLTATTANSRSTITAVTVDGTPQAGFTAADNVTLTNAVTLPSTLPAPQVTVKITVTGEDPTVTKEYTLTVAYPPVLTSLGFTSGGTPVSFRNERDTMDVLFNKHTFEYYIFAAQLSPSVMGFTAVPESDATYTVKVNGTAHTGAAVPLPSVGGETLVTFTVEKAGLQNEYKVHIKRKSYTVTLKAEDSDGGTISVTNPTAAGIGSVDNNNSAAVTVKAEIGATITATAIPKTDYTFIRWSGISVTSQTNPSLSYAVGSDAVLKAEFKSPDIYVRGTNSDWYNNIPGAVAGNDSTGTGSKQTPYATVSKALSQCTKTGTAYTIFVDGTIEENTTLNIPSGKKVTIVSLRKDTPAVIEEKRVSPSAYQYLIKTAGTLTLDSVILKANKTGTHAPNANTFICGIQQNGEAVTVKGERTEIKNFAHAVEITGGTFTMENGSICENYINGGASGVAIKGGGTFTLKGGSIKDNEATNRAGVSVEGSGSANKGTFTMTGGEISGNKAWCLGGGIYVGEHGQADISGGKIKANHAAQGIYSGGDVGGGGIYIGNNGTVNFTGGAIEGNIIHEVEKNCGAGVLIGEQGTFNMSGGIIKDCTTQASASRPSRGVGVYVSGGSTPNTEGTFKMTGGTIENCKPLAGHTGAGGAVYVGQYGKFSMSGNVNISTNETDTGKNDIYLATGTKITIAGKLDRNYHVARITPESYPASSSSNTQVLENPESNTTNVAENYFKFTVTRDSTTNKAYCVNEAGLIRQQVDTTPDDVGFQNWGKLKAAIQSASNNDVIYLRDNCTASNANDTITVDNKTITLIGVTGSHINLSADGKCRIFTIQNGGDLTIKNLSLKDGSSADGKGGSGILLENTGSNDKSLTLENTEITGCVIRSGPVSHGAGIAIHKGTVTMKDKAAIKSCENQRAGGFGGGVYIGSGGTLNINGSLVDNPVGSTDISSCKAEKGGGVYIANGGKLNLIKGRILGNRATGSTGEGYAVYNENSSANTFNWSGGKIMSHSVYGGATVIKGPCYNTSGNTEN